MWRGKQSKAEESKAKQSRGKQSKAKQRKAEESKAKQSKAPLGHGQLGATASHFLSRLQGNLTKHMNTKEYIINLAALKGFSLV
jgi:hypothetical protein